MYNCTTQDSPAIRDGQESWIIAGKDEGILIRRGPIGLPAETRLGWIGLPTCLSCNEPFGSRSEPGIRMTREIHRPPPGEIPEGRARTPR